jgi:hypothetical protein
MLRSKIMQKDREEKVLTQRNTCKKTTHKPDTERERERERERWVDSYKLKRHIPETHLFRQLFVFMKNKLGNTILNALEGNWSYDLKLQSSES